MIFIKFITCPHAYSPTPTIIITVIRSLCMLLSNAANFESRDGPDGSVP